MIACVWGYFLFTFFLLPLADCCGGLKRLKKTRSLALAPTYSRGNRLRSNEFCINSSHRSLVVFSLLGPWGPKEKVPRSSSSSAWEKGKETFMHVSLALCPILSCKLGPWSRYALRTCVARISISRACELSANVVFIPMHCDRSTKPHVFLFKASQQRFLRFSDEENR